MFGVHRPRISDVADAPNIQSDGARWRKTLSAKKDRGVRTEESAMETKEADKDGGSNQR